jgi:hypothetical protein
VPVRRRRLSGDRRLGPRDRPGLPGADRPDGHGRRHRRPAH